MRAIFVFCLLIIFSDTRSQDLLNYFPPVSNFGIEQGLSNNAVRSIFKDSKGYMWFGTYDGLNQYDGYTCTVFRNEFSDSSSLVNNWINSINEDAANRLWIGTRKGLSIFNRNERNFTPAQFMSADSRKINAFSGVVKQIIRANNHLLVATQQEGLLVGNDKTSVLKQAALVLNGRLIYNYDVLAMEAISPDSCLLVVLNTGICSYDLKSNQVRLLNPAIRNASCIKKLGNVYWIGSDKGIFIFNRQLNTISTGLSLSAELSATKVIDISRDRKGVIWIATNGDGLFVYHPQSGKVDLANTETKPALSSDAVYRIYEDEAERKWIGTIRGGIDIFDRQKSRFTTIRHDPYNANSPGSNFILSYFEAPDGKVWIGSDGGGLSIWNRENNTYKDVRKGAGLSDNFILNIKQDRSMRTWLSTYYGGINRCSGEPGKISQYHLYNPGDPLKELLTYSLCIDSGNTVWVGTLSLGGLYKYNEVNDNFELFDRRLTDLFVMQEDRRGRLWGGNLTQLVLIDRREKKHLFYNIGQPVRCIAEDSGNRFWVGTEGGGLILFDRSTNKILKRYTIAQGLANNAVLSILPDKNGQLWMSTFNGISRFDIAGETFKNYYQNDGLQSNQFNYNAGIRLRSGEFVFGGIKGMNIFRPEQIKPVTAAPPLVLRNLLINSNNPFSDNEIRKELADNNLRVFTVPYDKALFSFEFAALEFSAPEKIAYSYFLQGWDKDWISAGNTRRALYTQLKEGKYLFRVRSTLADGGWNKEELQIRIVVLPPWYRSWWAYTVYGLMIAAGIFFYNRYRTQKARLHYSLTIANLNAEKERAELKNEKLEREKQSAEFEKERAEHEKNKVLNEKEKEINEKKLEFFTNIAHEFRTPLTLITNPVKELILRQNADPQETRELKIVYGNARRMANLVDQLLLFQKGEQGLYQLQPEQLQLKEFVQEVIGSFSQLARLKQIDYQLAFEDSRFEVWADRNKLEIILYNLISNALKYTPAGGKVKCSIGETDSHLIIAISDTGYGIPAEAGEKIFDRFYQAKGPAPVGQPGFGIGLYLVKQLVEAHYGNITYTSIVDAGTTFKLELVKGNAHFDNGTIFLKSVPAQAGGASSALTVDSDISHEGATNETLFPETKTMLIIDDDMQMLQYISGLFKGNFTIHNAASGEEGLELAKKYIPDIIISDIRMGGLNGIEVCRAIKKDPTSGHIPVILLTGTSSNGTRLESIEGGADDYITKPFDNEILSARVESLLKNRTALQHYFFNVITLQPHQQKISPEYKQFIQDCIQLVEEHLEEEDFGVNELAQKLAVSRSNLFRKVKSVSGLSIISFIRFIRLRKAAQIFISTNSNVNETAAQVGITDMRYFRKQFHKLFGVNPSEYISKYRKPFNDTITVNRDSFDNR